LPLALPFPFPLPELLAAAAVALEGVVALMPVAALLLLPPLPPSFEPP
jgi:hypothetical protein